MRDLGRLGESVFSQWCASAGLTANGANVDETDWDFVVDTNCLTKPHTITARCSN
jgi:tRNA(Ser,Leu) C12 N-acetylase TAN1